MQEMTEKLVEIAGKAGKAILKIYHSEELFQEIETKSDNSPLTLADKASNQVIVEALKEHYPEIPILSEEEKEVPYEERKGWDTFWCVDPLDGTKEFIKRNDEFTVNIALIKDGYPTAGVIYIPVQDTFFVSDGSSSWKIENGEKKALQVNATPDTKVAVRSRSHASPEETTVYEKYGIEEFSAAGSSLKFCRVAEGEAFLYYRHGPTMEWDTAAGQAIVEGAGGKVLEFENKARFFYNKENLRNGSFIVLSE